LVRKGLLAGVVLVAMVRAEGPDPGPSVQDRPRGPVDPATCIRCHATVTDHDTIHGPVTVNACDACHTVESVEEHTYTLARTGTELCLFCHDVDLDSAAVVHAPLTEGGDCLGCHDPHGGTDTKFLKAPTVDALCRDCHADSIGNGQHVHGPVAMGACSVCHEPHASNHEGLLVAPAAEMCTNCHAATETQISSQRVVHAPARDNCQTCHDPHASDFPMMLRDEPQRLCLSCHETVRHTVETANTQHAAVTTDRQCMNCHDPHASDHPRVLLTDMKSLCLECHDRVLDTDDGGTISDIKAVIDGGTNLHGPVAQSNCAGCHQIHGGDHFRMLVREYPAEFYAPFEEESYALCFSCHEKQLVLDARTTALTDFRNGDQNLHFLHVNRDKKGRTCRACHETHASTNPKHIRDSVPFGRGGWQLPINFEKTPSGGSCAPGCHKPYEYDRFEPLEYEGGGNAIWPQ
jgi:predicted CXXCH cytochrome family protein